MTDQTKAEIRATAILLDSVCANLSAIMKDESLTGHQLAECERAASKINLGRAIAHGAFRNEIPAVCADHSGDAPCNS